MNFHLNILSLWVGMFLSLMGLYYPGNELYASTTNETLNNEISLSVNLEDPDCNITVTKTFTIYFPINKSIIISDFKNNGATLDSLNIFMDICFSDTVLLIHNISLVSSCSVDGSSTFNRELSVSRYKSCMTYLKEKYPQLSEYPIDITSLGENWDDLKKFTDNRSILNIIDEDSTEDIRTQQLMRFNNGQIYDEFKKTAFPELRYAKIMIKYDSLFNNEGASLSSDISEIEEINIIEEVIIPKPVTNSGSGIYEITQKPLFAVKTNLLYDLATALNVEIEVPIRKRWSVCGEWIFPWWQHTKDRAGSKPYRLEILCGTLEGRYWYGNRRNRPVLNGWFTGIYYSMGLYDVQWKAKGYQGESAIGLGITGGYNHKIGKNLSMEYGLGVGYFKTHYRHYKSWFGFDERWHPIKTNNGRYSWFGPTRLKVSLVWMLNYKTKKGGIL